MITVHTEMVNNLNPIAILYIEGLIDTDTSRELKRIIDQAISKKHYRLVFDLMKVEYISSAGWGIFIGELKQLRLLNGDLKLASLAPEVENVYRLLEFYNVLEAFATADAALKAFEK